MGKHTHTHTHMRKATGVSLLLTILSCAMGFKWSGRFKIQFLNLKLPPMFQIFEHSEAVVSRIDGYQKFSARSGQDYSVSTSSLLRGHQNLV